MKHLLARTRISSICICYLRTCNSRPPRVVNVFVHWLQEYGRSPVCTRTWAASILFDTNHLSQCGQRWVFRLSPLGGFCGNDVVAIFDFVVFFVACITFFAFDCVNCTSWGWARWWCKLHFSPSVKTSEQTGHTKPTSLWLSRCFFKLLRCIKPAPQMSQLWLMTTFDDSLNTRTSAEEKNGMRKNSNLW